MKKIPIWIDTDCGVDDAMALITAVSLPEVELVGVSAVAGNVELEKTFKNARNVLALAGRSDIPVYPGADRPLMRKLETAAYVHGVSGLGRAVLPDSPAEKETEAAWDALYRTAKQYAGELELILVGPDTNAAIALRKYPDLAQLIKRILIMGGSASGGNVTASAEFNIYVDPHAAQVVFKSGIPIVMCGLDVTEKGGFTFEEAEAIDGCDSAGCRFFSDATATSRELYRKEGLTIIAMHDSMPVLYCAHPELFEGTLCGVFVETRAALTMGMTVCDIYTDVKFGVKNAVVVTGVDRKKAVGYIESALKAI